MQIFKITSAVFHGLCLLFWALFLYSFSVFCGFYIVMGIVFLLNSLMGMPTFWPLHPLIDWCLANPSTALVILIVLYIIGFVGFISSLSARVSKDMDSEEGESDPCVW